MKNKSQSTFKTEDLNNPLAKKLEAKVTKEGRGDWVWDTLFDATNRTAMHPEYIGPIIRRHLPLY
jgi:hypothetical protein